MFTPLGAVKHWEQENPDRLLLTFVEIVNGRFVEENRTAGELLTNGLRLASALEKAGIREGERFAIVMRNHPEFIEAMLASEILGTVFVPIDVRVQPERLSYMIEHTECQGAIISAEGYENFKRLDEIPERLKWVWGIDEFDDEKVSTKVNTLDRVLERVDDQDALAREVKPRELHETMQMLFTSGTTGDPKAIQTNYARFAQVGPMTGILGLTEDDRPYTGLSLTHANAQIISLGYSFALGLPLVISRTFTKSRLWDIVAYYKCTTFNLLGGMATALFSEPEKPTDREHNVRFVLSAGMPTSMWEQFEQRFNVKIFEFYATAEGGLTFNPPGVGPVGSIGQPPPGIECAILDENDEACKPYEIGEICFRNTDGEVDPVQYYKNPEASEEKIRGNWFRSGDCGYKDEEAWVYFSYRAGDSVRRSGEFINVEDMMTSLAKHSQINDVYVFGVPLASNAPGEKTVIASIVLEEEESFAIDAFIEEVKEVVGESPEPDYYQFIDEIPKTASEKPINRFLMNYLKKGEGMIYTRNGKKVDRINTEVSQPN